MPASTFVLREKELIQKCCFSKIAHKKTLGAHHHHHQADDVSELECDAV